ncbi:LysR family transcriptional regulator [Amycolatopsis sp. NPDC059027]|uniref:LysR family transcriptional regulator n=1 Tax=unclassified Amycolatopsis TaxID=2618356 RepID=UPI003672767C
MSTRARTGVACSSRAGTVTGVARRNEPGRVLLDAIWSDDSRLTLLQLEALYAVANEGSFAAAAATLGCTQPAVSQRIASIERRLGVVLVRRVSGQRQVRLTEAGTTLVNAAEQVQVILRTATRQIEDLRDGKEPAVRIGVFSSVAVRVMPLVLAAINAHRVPCRVKLVEVDDDVRLQELLRFGEIDLAFVIFPLQSGRAHGLELFDDPFILLAPRRSPLASLPRLRPVDLRGLPMVCLTSEKYEVAAELRRQGVEPNWVFDTDKIHVVEPLVAADVGYSIVPQLALGQRHPDVVRFSLSEIVAPREIGIAWPPHHPRLGPLLRVADVIRAVCASPADILPPIDQPGRLPATGRSASTHENRTDRGQVTITETGVRGAVVDLLECREE